MGRECEIEIQFLREGLNAGCAGLFLRPGLFTDLALVWCEVREYFTLGEKQRGGQHSSHYVGNGAGGPHTSQPVEAVMSENNRYDKGQRQQEDELP